MNTMTFEKLQYNELKEIVKSYCVSGLGKQLLDNLQPSSNIKVVKNRLNETTEAKAILNTESHVPLVGISNIENIIGKLEKGMILEPAVISKLSGELASLKTEEAIEEYQTLEPMYKLIIGESGDSNALWISRKMNLRERVLERALCYMKNKDYNLELVKENKIKKPEVNALKTKETYEYEVGDKVTLLDHNDSGIVYKKKDSFNNIVVLYKEEFIVVNCKRVISELKAAELYPEGYDLNTLFVSYKERKLQHDIERGSKKALRKIQKEIRKK
ncbi:hypothetical protein V7166_17740 [Bacillus thuringiensis]